MQTALPICSVEKDACHEIKALAGLPNLGPVTAARLHALGITNEERLKEVGAVHAYQLLKAAYGPHVSLNALYALHGALVKSDWRALSPALKAELAKNAQKGQNHLGKIKKFKGP
jgi:DNA transformation protein and related proteins